MWHLIFLCWLSTSPQFYSLVVCGYHLVSSRVILLALQLFTRGSPISPPFTCHTSFMLVPWFVTWDTPVRRGVWRHWRAWWKTGKHAIWMERMHDATLKSLYSMCLCSSQRLWFVSFVVKVTRHVFFKSFCWWVNEWIETYVTALFHGIDEHGPFLLNWGYHINSILNLMSLIIQSGQVRIGFPTRQLPHSLTYHKSVTYYILHNRKRSSQPLQCIILKAMIITSFQEARVGVLHDLIVSFEVLFPLSWATMILRRHTM